MLLPVFAAASCWRRDVLPPRSAGPRRRQRARRCASPSSGASLRERYEDVDVLETSGSLVFLNGASYPQPAGGGPPRIEGLTAIRRSDQSRWAHLVHPRRRGSGHLGRAPGPGCWRTASAARSTPIDERMPHSAQASRPSRATLHARPGADLQARQGVPPGAQLLRGPGAHAPGSDRHSYQTLWHYHLTFPLANLILLLVGIPLMFNYERGKGSERIAIGGLLCVFYYAADFVFRTLGIKGQLLCCSPRGSRS